MLPTAPPLPDHLFSSSTSKQFPNFSRTHRHTERLEYGRPPKGSRTEQRALAAQAHIHQEVRYLCEMIQHMGEKLERTSAEVHYQVTFRQLFDVYTNVSNKLVGILLRARKHGYIHFPEEYEVLFQNQHDDVKITLLRMPED